MENNDLISRNAALELCQKEYDKRLQMFDYCGDTVAYNIGGAIKLLPAVDAVPVVHARWISVLRGDAGQTVYCMDKCSKCGNIVGYGINLRYCPNCGAQMYGKDD